MVSIHNRTKQKSPRFDYQKIKTLVLGRQYDLSIGFIGSHRSQTLNKKYRKKDKPTDILAFPLSSKSGEILIDLKTAKKKAKLFGYNKKNYPAYLIIHGLLHLKGYGHGSTMEQKEKKIMKVLKLKLSQINEPTHSYRSRYRHDLDSRRRV